MHRLERAHIVRITSAHRALLFLRHRSSCEANVRVSKPAVQCGRAEFRSIGDRRDYRVRPPVKSRNLQPLRLCLRNRHQSEAFAWAMIVTNSPCRVYRGRRSE